jgi:hypothetical protein
MWNSISHYSHFALDKSIPLSELQLHLQSPQDITLSGPETFTTRNQWILIHSLCLFNFVKICKHTHIHARTHAVCIFNE